MKNLILFIIVFFTFSCHSTSIADYQVNKRVFDDTIAGAIKYDSTRVCQLFIGKWDSILIINPYIATNIIKNLNVNNYYSIKDIVNTQRMNDYTCTLVFTYENSYIGYCVLNRNRLDFTYIPANMKQQFAWIKKSECQHLKIYKSKESTGYIAIERN